MSTHNQDLYLLNPKACYVTLYDALSECLSKADALASLTLTEAFEEYINEFLRNYLWTLCHLIQEAQDLNQALSEYYFQNEKS